MKRWFSIGVLLIAMLIMASCGVSNTAGNTESNGSSDQAQTQQPEQESAEQKKEPPEKADIKIGLSVPCPCFGPIYVADAKGFYKDEGLDASIVSFKGGSDVLQAMASNSIDVTASTPSGLISAIKNGQKMKAFWAGFNMPLFYWYANGVDSWEELRGKKIGVSKYGSLTDVLTRFALEQEGLEPMTDVNVVQTGGTPQAYPALEAGQLDAAILSVPFNLRAEDAGLTLLAQQSKYTGEEWPTEMWYAQESFMKENPNTIKALLRAHIKAVEFMKANKEETVDIWAQVLNYKPEDAAKAYDQIIDLFFADGHLPPQETMDMFWQIEISLGEVDEAWPQDRWFDDSLMNTVDEWK